MAKLYFRYGAMGSSKTANAIMVRHNYLERGQKVLYITERCVFILTARGLKLLEVYPGVDPVKDILELLPFDVETGSGINPLF